MKKLAAGAILFGLALGAVLAQTRAAPQKLRIVASILPLMEFAKAVAGGNAEVSLLLPPGAEVHTWQPRASDIIRMAEADLFVHIGGGLEPWVNDFLGSVTNERLRVLATADFLQMKKEEHAGEEAFDPHVWLDFENDRAIVRRLAGTMAEIDPARAAVYSEQASAYDKKLEELDGLYAEGLRSCPDRVLLLAGHEAFGYLARRYRLEQVALTGLSPDAEPTPRAVVAVVEMARKRGIRAVFREAGESSKLAELLAREIPAEVFVLNAGANVGRWERDTGTTFIDLMKKNLVSLKKGLGCE